MKPSSARWAVIGILAALGTGAGLWLLPSSHALDIYVVLLSLFAGIYVGSALSQKDSRAIARESMVAGAYVMLALLGRWVSPRFLVVGYLTHGVWDVFHETRLLRRSLTSWWPLFCLSYDWTLAALIYIRWVR